LISLHPCPLDEFDASNLQLREHTHLPWQKTVLTAAVSAALHYSAGGSHGENLFQVSRLRKLEKAKWNIGQPGMVLLHPGDRLERIVHSRMDSSQGPIHRRNDRARTAMDLHSSPFSGKVHDALLDARPSVKEFHEFSNPPLPFPIAESFQVV
jgi:hypothetical protein